MSFLSRITNFSAQASMFLQNYLLWLDSKILVTIFGLGFLLPSLFLKYVEGKKPPHIWIKGPVLLFSFGLMSWIVFGLHFAGRDRFLSWVLEHKISYSVSLIGGIGSYFLTQRYVHPWVSDFLNGFKKRSSLERNNKTDVRSIGQFLPSSKRPFDPRKYFSLGKIFLGLNEHKAPVYVAHKQLTHIDITGPTGTGKGVLLGVVATQLIAHDELVIVLDPKNDEWLPHVIYTAATRAGKPYQYIELGPTAPPQFDIFQGATAEQIEELLVGGFSLGEKGAASDFYSIADRRAAATIAHNAQGKTARQLYAEHNEALGKMAPKFVGLLEEIASLDAINAPTGLNIRSLLTTGGALYVVGSLRNPKVIRLQRMLLIRIVQLCEERDRLQGVRRQITVILDELKYHLSRPAIEALATARDKGLRLLMAHQSLNDLRDCPADLSADAVVGAVTANTPLKIAYHVTDPDTADWLARLSGTIQVDDEIRQVSTSPGLAERVSLDRTIRQSERYLIDKNMLQNLPRGVAVLYGQGLAQFIHCSPLTVDRDRRAVTPIATTQSSSSALRATELI